MHRAIQVASGPMAKTDVLLLFKENRQSCPAAFFTSFHGQTSNRTRLSSLYYLDILPYQRESREILRGQTAAVHLDRSRRTNVPES